jgi:sialate O-acetylesterase
LINAWRAAWGRPDLPFLFVQLPNLARQPEPSRSGWAELREAQLMTLATPHTGMAVTIDIGDPKDLHPTNKKDVGHRLAFAAEALVHGLPAAGRLSPMFARAEADGAKMRVRFKAADPLTVRGGGELKGFVIAGADKVFQPAQARIEGDSVVVWSDAVAAPAAVRYAWADNPDCNLTGSTGLPASPFRTDDWPAVTTGKR